MSSSLSVTKHYFLCELWTVKQEADYLRKCPMHELHSTKSDCTGGKNKELFVVLSSKNGATKGVFSTHKY